jgi:hypothetical protein
LLALSVRSIFLTPKTAACDFSIMSLEVGE